MRFKANLSQFAGVIGQNMYTHRSISNLVCMHLHDQIQFISDAASVESMSQAKAGIDRNVVMPGFKASQSKPIIR